MNEFEEKINQLLSSPGAMEQILSLAQSLGVGKETSVPPAEPEQAAEPEQFPSHLLSLLGSKESGGFDPKIIGLLTRAASAWSQPDDQKTALLQALRPFLRPERAAKMDRAMQISKIARIVRIAMEVLKGGEHTV